MITVSEVSFLTRGQDRYVRACEVLRLEPTSGGWAVLRCRTDQGFGKLTLLSPDVFRVQLVVVALGAVNGLELAERNVGPHTFTEQFEKAIVGWPDLG